MKDCSSCKTEDSMYDTANGKKCWKCGHTWTPNHNIRERPNRPDNANCGDVLERVDGETENPYRRIMNADGSNCSHKPVGIQKQDGEYVVVCSRHRESWQKKQ